MFSYDTVVYIERNGHNLLKGHHWKLVSITLMRIVFFYLGGFGLS
mgnify:CR=1 FL=1